MIYWRSMNDPELVRHIKARAAILVRMGSHIATVYYPTDESGPYTTHNNQALIQAAGDAQPTAWAAWDVFTKTVLSI